MRPRPPLVTLVFLLSLLVSAGAEDFDPTRFIGLDLPAAVSALGLPQAMSVYRAAEDKLDNVVFYYPDFLYLFWYKNKVWQVRCDRRFAEPVLGLTLGMPREQVERAIARQLTPNGDSLYFDLDTGSYPLRVRLVFMAGVLSDLYVYRSDF
jgi:hypothetical protein